jgi:ligand-binding SRPBCC domain-containing protein
MKYADCPTVQFQTRVAAPPAAVWRWVIDLDTPAHFSSEFRGADWLDGAAPGLGARFAGRNEHPAIGTWETTCVVVGFEPERLFAWAVGDAEHPAAMWRFELEPAGDGTVLRQWARMGPGPSGLSRAIGAMPDKEERIVARRIEEFRANIVATVEGIRELAERDAR